MAVTTLMTADELLLMPEDGWRYQLVNGELQKMSPSGAEHVAVAAQIIWSLMARIVSAGFTPRKAASESTATPTRSSHPTQRSSPVRAV